MNARKKLEGLKHIRFAQQHRRPPDDRLGNLQGTKTGGPDAGIFPSGHFCSPDPGVRNQGDILCPILFKPQLQCFPTIADIGDRKLDVAFRNRQRVKSITVGDRADVSGKDASPNQRFAGGGIRYITAEGNFPDLPENHVVPFDLIPDIPPGEQLFQAFFQICPGHGFHSTFQWQGSIVHKPDTIFFFQRRHPVFQGGLRPQSGTCKQQHRRQHHSFHRFFFSLVDTQW